LTPNRLSLPPFDSQKLDSMQIVHNDRVRRGRQRDSCICRPGGQKPQPSPRTWPAILAVFGGLTAETLQFLYQLVLVHLGASWHLFLVTIRTFGKMVERRMHKKNALGVEKCPSDLDDLEWSGNGIEPRLSPWQVHSPLSYSRVNYKNKPDAHGVNLSGIVL